MNNLLNRRQFLSLSSGASLMLLGGNSQAQTKGLQKHVRRSFTLGTEITFTVFHHNSALAEQAMDEALVQIDKVENLMSLYRPESQLNQVNREGILRNPDPLLVDVLKRAKELSKLSEGAFDVTIQPLWRLFRKNALKGQLPEPSAIAKAK